MKRAAVTLTLFFGLAAAWNAHAQTVEYGERPPELAECDQAAYRGERTDAALCYQRLRASGNVVISNIPGPPFPLYLAGGRMVHNYPMGPIYDGGGLNITVMSYLDNLDFGIQACPDVLPDVWSLAHGLQEALDELVAATSGRDHELAALSRSTRGEYSVFGIGCTGSAVTNSGKFLPLGCCARPKAIRWYMSGAIRTVPMAK